MTSVSLARRVFAIDIFRGLTIFTMVFVNELAGTADIPRWMEHMPAAANSMSFVDVVFPAFLFIVGMSIPFATESRAGKGDSSAEIFKHIALRSLALIVIGVFMVNAESGYDASLMPISIAWWSLLMFICVFLLWAQYPKTLPAPAAMGGKLLGIAGLVILWWLYRGADNKGMTPQWWGILGLIGWAYLIAASIYLLSRKITHSHLQLAVICAAALILLLLFFVLNLAALSDIPLLATLAENNRNNTHAVIVLGGVVLSLLFYHPAFSGSAKKSGFIFALVSLLLAFLCWHFSPISKIWATPSWGMFSVFFCCLVFAGIYWIVDVRGQQAWGKVFEPAAENPLLVYLLPYILFCLLSLSGVHLRPALFDAGALGILWSLAFAVAIMWLGAGVNKLGVKLKL